MWPFQTLTFVRSPSSKANSQSNRHVSDATATNTGSDSQSRSPSSSQHSTASRSSRGSTSSEAPKPKPTTTTPKSKTSTEASASASSSSSPSAASSSSSGPYSASTASGSDAKPDKEAPITLATANDRLPRWLRFPYKVLCASKPLAHLRNISPRTPLTMQGGPLVSWHRALLDDHGPLPLSKLYHSGSLPAYRRRTVYDTIFHRRGTLALPDPTSSWT